MRTKNAAECLAALGHVNRLELFQLLVRAGEDGMNIGEIQKALALPASTLAFHLRELTSAKLVVQNKEGRSVRCQANFHILNEVLMYLRRDCCKGVSLPVFSAPGC